MQTQYFPYYPYPQTIMLQNEYQNAYVNEYRNEYGPEHYNDERFFPFFPLLAPVAFVAGLAIGPLLFNRPYYPPYPPPYPPAYPPYPAYPAYQGFQGYPQQFGAQAGVSENINIYTH